MTTPSAQFRIDQPDGGGTGTPGIARIDLWRTKRVNLVPTSPPAGATYAWSMVKPRGSTAVFLDPATGLPNSNCAVPYFMPDLWGTYLLQCSINNGAYTLRLVAATRYDGDGTLMKFGWRYPALNEDWLAASDPYGWKQSIEDIFDSIYGVLSSMLGQGGNAGDDGAARRASNPTDEIERRTRLRELGNTVGGGGGPSIGRGLTSTIETVIDQRRLADTIVQLVTYSGGDIGRPVESGKLRQGPEIGSSYGLVVIDPAVEGPLFIVTLDLLNETLPGFQPYSIVCYGTQVAVVTDVGIAVLELTRSLAARASVTPDMAIVVNPDVGGGFGVHARVTMLTESGMPRLLVTDQVNEKIYTARIKLPADINGAGAVVVGATVSSVWTGTDEDPYGMTMDDAGNLWVAFKTAGAIVKYGVSTIGSDEVQLVEKQRFLDTSPIELAFDGVYVIATHSYEQIDLLTGGRLGLTWDNVTSGNVTCIGVALGDKRDLVLSLYNGTTDATVLPVVDVGPGRMTVSGEHVWLSCLVPMTSNSLLYDVPVPIRLNPVSSRATPGWPLQEWADRIYAYLLEMYGSFVSITTTSGAIAVDGANSLYCPFTLQTSAPIAAPMTTDKLKTQGGFAAPIQFVMHVLATSRTVEADFLALRSIMTGALLSVLPASVSGLGTEGVGGAVVPLVGTSPNDVPIWNGTAWVVGASPGGSVATHLTLVAGLQYADVGAGVDKVAGSTPSFVPASTSGVFSAVGSVPVSSTGRVQLYDVTNHVAIYDSDSFGGLAAGDFEISEVVTLAVGSQRLEMWVQTVVDTGGDMGCLHAELEVSPP